MKPSRRFRVLSTLGAQSYDQTVSVGVQFISVPVLLATWGAELYGTWLILAAIPIYVGLSDLGFNQVAINDMTMKVAANDRGAAVRVFQSTMSLLMVVSAFVVLGAATFCFFFPVREVFNITLLSDGEISTTLMMLVAYVVACLFMGLVQAGYRCDGRFSIAIAFSGTARLIENAGLLAVASFGGGLVEAATAYLAGRVLIAVIMAITLRRLSPWLLFGFSEASLTEIRRLARPAISYLAFPIGRALSIQGFVIVIGNLLTPTSVVIFSTLRTLSRTGSTAADMLSISLLPEYSMIFGQKNIGQFFRLFWRHLKVALFVCAVYFSGVYTLGPAFVDLWTGGKVPTLEPLFSYLLIGVCAEMLWSTIRTPFISLNWHQLIAVAYLIAAGVSLAACILLIGAFGIEGAGLATVSLHGAMVVVLIFRLRRRDFAALR